MGSAMMAARRLGTKNLVGFEVGGVRYALDIHRVSEIIRPLNVVQLSHMPSTVLGVCDHRGDVVPVIDLRQRFGLPREQRLPHHRRWIVVIRGRRLVALVVDRVTEVFGGDAARERDVPELGEHDDARGISTVYSHQGGLVFVVDVDLVTKVSEQLDMSVAQEMLQRECGE